MLKGATRATLVLNLRRRRGFAKMVVRGRTAALRTARAVVRSNIRCSSGAISMWRRNVQDVDAVFSNFHYTIIHYINTKALNAKER